MAETTVTKADLVEIRWPGGKVQQFKNVPANQFFKVVQDAR